MLKFSLLILLLIPLISTQAQPTNRIYGSYFGGSGNDWITSSAVHADGTYALGGNTNAGGLPTTPNAFQQFYSGAAQDEDAFIAIFNPDHTLKYCSYFGGIGNDNLTEMVFHNDKLFFCGTSFADNMQGTIGSHQQLHAGSLDGFIGCLDLSGNLVWLTMYGTNEYDAILGLTVINNKVVCVGSTASGENFTTTDAIQPLNAGGFDAFMLVMSIDGQVEYCTLMGTSEADQAWRIKGDSQGNIYMMGQSLSQTGMSTAGSLQEENAGGSDLFIAQFDSNYQLNWSTYFGGSGFETGMDMMVDSNDLLWVSDIYIKQFTN